MKRENNTGIIIAITAAAAAVLAIMIAGLVFVLPIVKGKCTDFFVDQKLEQGYKYLARQDYKPAIAAFNTVIKVDDKRTEAYIGLGDAYSGRKDWVPAANYYSLAIDKVQNGTDSIESASFADDYLEQSGSRDEKGGKNGLSVSSINNHSGNTSIVVADNDEDSGDWDDTGDEEMSGSNGEDTDYFLAGAKEDIQQQELTDLISDTETEIREGMKMS